MTGFYDGDDRDPPLPVGLILGAAIWSGGVASPSLRRRALHAAQLYHAGLVQALIACGGVGRYPPSEAELICAICRDQSVPQEALFKEADSTNTVENIRFSLPILERIAEPDVVIITDAYHAPRAKIIARFHGLRPTSSSPTLTNVPAQARMKAYAREGAALLKYLVRSW